MLAPMALVLVLAVAAASSTAAPLPAKIALYYSGWQLVGQRPDQPTAGDTNNKTRVEGLLGRGFTHAMLEHGNDATLVRQNGSKHGDAVCGSNCSSWASHWRCCQSSFASRGVQ